RALRVVHDNTAPERARPRRREEAQLELALPEATPQASGDDDRLPLVRETALVELVDRRGERLLTGISLHSGIRERWWLDHDRRSPSSLCELRERRAGEREAQGVAYRGDRVRDLLRRW